MDGLIHAKIAFCQRGGGEHTDGTGDLAGLVGQDVAKDVAGDDHVELTGVADQLHGSVVHVHVVQGDLRVVLGNLFHHASPQAGGVQNVGLVHAGDLLVPLHGHVKSHLGNAADLTLGVHLHVVGGGTHVGLLGAALAEVDAAGELTDHHDVQTAGEDLGLQGRGIGQLLEDDGGTDVGKEAQLLADAQQSTLRTLAAGEVVPLGAAHSAQQDGIGSLADVDGLLGQAAAGGIDGSAAGQHGLGGEGVAELVAHLAHDLHGLLHDVGADAVAGDHSDIVIHVRVLPYCLSLMEDIRPPAWMISLMNSGKGRD